MWRNATLTLGPVSDSTLQVYLSTGWRGFADRAPVEEQRRFVVQVTSVLQGIRRACTPVTTSSIDCVTHGLGGKPACEGGE